jgi:hypothetical protein
MEWPLVWRSMMHDCMLTSQHRVETEEHQFGSHGCRQSSTKGDREKDNCYMSVCARATKYTCAWLPALGVRSSIPTPGLVASPHCLPAVCHWHQVCRAGSDLLRADISVGGWWRHRASSRNRTNRWARPPGDVRLLAFVSVAASNLPYRRWRAAKGLTVAGVAGASCQLLSRRGRSPLEPFLLESI